jgi:hypothetical protein
MQPGHFNVFTGAKSRRPLRDPAARRVQPREYVSNLTGPRYRRGGGLCWPSRRPISPGVDRLAINPDGPLLYVPTWEGGSADYINVFDANSGEIVQLRSRKCTAGAEMFARKTEPVSVWPGGICPLS